MPQPSRSGEEAASEVHVLLERLLATIDIPMGLETRFWTCQS